MTEHSREGAVAPGRTAGAPDAEVLRPRTFWIVFASAWLVYAALACTTVLLRGESMLAAIVASLAVVTPMALPAIPLGLHRKRLLQPRASVPRFVAHKVLVGAGYAATVSILMWLTPIQPLRDLGGEESVAATAWFLNALFLYTIFLVFLMWLDALERIQESRSLVAQEASLRAQAEAKALRAQFNPHFVFNTLHSLMLLVRKDPGTAERAIEDVAGLIRYASTLQRREVDQVTLSKELAFARRYLALEKLRLADRLCVEWNVEEGLDDVLVPAFSLQTLLENSIKHGIAPRTEGGTVRICATHAAGRFTMVVEDDGLGAADAPLPDNGGSGLQLLRRRLHTVYGDDATIEWVAPPEGGFTVRIAVPERRAPPELEESS